MQVFPRMTIPEMEMKGVPPAISTHTRASSRRAISAQVCRGSQTFRCEVAQCQGHTPKPIKLVTSAGFLLFPSKVWATEMQPSGTEPPGEAAAKSKDLGRGLSSVTRSLWQEQASASRSWDTSLAWRSVAQSTSSQDGRKCQEIHHLKGVAGEQSEQEQPQRPALTFQRYSVNFFFFEEELISEVTLAKNARATTRLKTESQMCFLELSGHTHIHTHTKISNG